jgi:uncharacterized membrane protein HdeD (DUF308 family)
MELAEKVSELMAVVLAVLLGFNVVVSGVTSILQALKVKIPEDHFIHKLVDFVQKAVDLISANKEH